MSLNSDNDFVYEYWNTSFSLTYEFCQNKHLNEGINQTSSSNRSAHLATTAMALIYIWFLETVKRQIQMELPGV